MLGSNDPFRLSGSSVTPGDFAPNSLYAPTSMPAAPPDFSGVPSLGVQGQATAMPVAPPVHKGFDWLSFGQNFVNNYAAAQGSQVAQNWLKNQADTEASGADQESKMKMMLARLQAEQAAKAGETHVENGTAYRFGPDGRPIVLGQLPQAPTDWERAAEQGGYIRGTPEWTQLARLRAQNIADPVHPNMTLDPVTHMPMMVLSDRNGPVGNPGATGGAPNIPPEALDWLAKHPEDLPHFIAKYHVAPTQGGPAPQGPATFPGVR